MDASQPANALFQRLVEIPGGAALRQRARRRSFRAGETVSLAGDPLRWVSFPEAGALFVHSLDRQGSAIAASVVSWNGAFGLSEALGARQARHGCTARLDSVVLQAPVEEVRRAVLSDAQIADVVHARLDDEVADLRQAIGCLALHSVPQRLAWLLLTLDDASRGADFALTQQDLADGLAVQRTTVSMFANGFARAGAVRTLRGRIRLLDRAWLVNQACDCYVQPLELAPAIVDGAALAVDRLAASAAGAGASPIDAPAMEL